MKYKVIGAMAHNFTHSFVSWTNHVDGQYILDIIRDVTWKTPTRSFSIDWLPTVPILSSPVPSIVEKSIGYFRDWLPKHLDHHSISITALRSFRTVFTYTQSLSLSISVEVIDDRGKLHTAKVMY